MKDYSAIFPVEPIIGWTTTNYGDHHSKNGEVQQMQGFLNYDLHGKPLSVNSYSRDMIAVPEGRFHTGVDFFQPTPEQAIQTALEHVKHLNAEAERILASVRRVQKENT